MSEQEKRRPWSWAQFAYAMGMFPLSFGMWLVGLNAAFQSSPDLIGIIALIASPVVAIAGAIWLIVLLVRRFIYPAENTPDAS